MRIPPKTYANRSLRRTDCAQWLNGRGVGARYDGTYPGSSYIGSCDGKYSGTVSGLSQADHDNIARFINAQMQAFEYATGWIFWCWKNEAAPEWHFQNLTAAGMIPKLGSYGKSITFASMSKILLTTIADTSICG